MTPTSISSASPASPTAFSSGASRFSEARIIPDTLSMAWRSLITMLRNFGESFDILLQPIMFTIMFGEIFGAPSPGTSRPTCPRSSRD